MALIDDIAMIGKIDRVKHNDYLGIMVPLLVEFAQDYCNNQFDDVDPSGGVKLFIAESINHKLKSQGLQALTMGSVTYNYDVNLPDELIKYLRPYKKVRFR
ncbi:MAG: phage head-tail connector protein [Bacillota bacterium]